MSENFGIIKVGIAGLGRSGWSIHASLLSLIEEKYKITAVLDADLKRQKEAADRFGCRTYSDYSEFLKDSEIDLMVIAMPSHLHADYTIQALKAGKHVVCEKPMATSLKEADKMIAASEKEQKILSIFHNRRYSPDFQMVNEVIKSGCLGKIVMIRIASHGFSRRWDWQTLKKYGGGTLNNTGSHFIDQALVLFGREKPKIYCELKKTLTLGDTEDHVKVIISGKDSPSIEVEISSACAYPQARWLVMGTNGGLSGTENEFKWKYYDAKKMPDRKLETAPTPDRSYNKDTISWIEKTWKIEDDTRPGEAVFYLDLYETLNNNKPLVITPESVRRQMWIIDECHKMCPVRRKE